MNRIAFFALAPLPFILAACDTSGDALSGRRASRPRIEQDEVVRAADVIPHNCHFYRSPALRLEEHGTESEKCRMPRESIQDIVDNGKGSTFTHYLVRVAQIPGTEDAPRFPILTDFTFRNWTTLDLLHFSCVPEESVGEAVAGTKVYRCVPAQTEVMRADGSPMSPPDLRPFTNNLEMGSMNSGTYIAYRFEVKNPDCEASVSYTDSYASTWATRTIATP